MLEETYQILRREIQEKCDSGVFKPVHMILSRLRQNDYEVEPETKEGKAQLTLNGFLSKSN